MDAPIHNPHDSFVRRALEDLNVSSNLLQTELPSEIAALLDFSTLERINASYVSKALRQTYSDLVFRVRYQNSNRSVFIYALFEHKSQPDD